MSFDPSNRYQDHVESYSYNPYRQDHDIQRAHQITRAQGTVPGDSMETKQQQLERQLLNQYQSNHFRLPAGKFIIIAQVGKYLILAIALPPYFFFYGMPKWILEQTLPHISDGLDRMGEGIEKGWMRISAWNSTFFAFLKGKFSNLRSKEAKEKKVHEGDNLFKLLAKDISSHLQKIQAHLQKLSQVWQSAQASFVSSMQQTGNSMLKPFQWIKEFASSNFKFSFSENIERIQEYLKALRSRIPWKEAIKQKSKSLLDQVSDRFESVKRFTQDIAELSMNWALNFLSPFPAFIQQKIVYPFKKGANQLAKPLAIVANITISAVNFIQTKVQVGFNWFVNQVAKASQPIEKASQKAFKAITSLFRILLDRSKGMGKKGNFVKTLLLNKIQAIFDKNKNRAKKGFKKIQQKTKKAVQIAIKVGSWVLQEIRKLPSRFRDFIRWAIQALYNGIKKTVWSLRVALTWVKIIISHKIKSSWFS